MSRRHTVNEERGGSAAPTPAAFGWFLVLLVYLGGILYAVATGVAGRITAAEELPVVLAAAVALCMVVVLQMIVILRGRPFVAGEGFLVFLIPLLFAGLGVEYRPARSYTSAGAAGAAELNLNREITPEPEPASPDAAGIPDGFERADRIEDRSPAAPAGPDAWFGSAEKASVPERGVIEIDAANYYDLYNQIYDEMHALEGRTVTVDGFVHREASFSENEFLIGRMLMWCCAADAALLGFMTRVENHAVPGEDTWVSVTGTLTPRSFTNPHTGERYEVPYLSIESVSPAERPQFEYVFPF